MKKNVNGKLTQNKMYYRVIGPPYIHAVGQKEL